MLYWLLPSSQKQKSNRLAMKEGGFLEKNEQNTDRKRKKKKKLRRQ